MYIKTVYGKIPKKELIIEKIPSSPKSVLSNYLNKFYDEDIDLRTRHIKIYDKQMKEIGKINGTKISKILFKRSGYMKVVGSKHKIKVIKYITPKLAYFLGYFYGDGGLKDIRRSYKISNRYEHKMIIGDEFKIQIEEIIIPLFKEIFNLEVVLRLERIRKGERMYYVNPTSKIVYRYLTKLFDLNEGPKNNIMVPKIIFNSNKEIRKWFLRGLLDADGDTRASESYTHKKISSPRIKIRMREKSFLIQIKDILNSDFGFGFTGPYSGREKEYYLQTGKKDLLKAFEEKLFIHPIKRWRLKKYIDLMGA